MCQCSVLRGIVLFSFVLLPAAEDLRRLTARHPDVKANCFNVKFRDSRGRRGQKDTLVTDARGIVELIMLMTGSQAA